MATGHQAYLPGTGTLKKIVTEFGEGVLAEDGTINRNALRAIVFPENQDKVRKLSFLLRAFCLLYPADGKIRSHFCPPILKNGLSIHSLLQEK